MRALHYIIICLCLLSYRVNATTTPATPAKNGACFLLYEIGVGEIRRAPSDICKTRLSPASTFKIPHALIALDVGAASGPQEKILYDGTGNWPELMRHDQTLATAIKYSAVWYFQQLAERIGAENENVYLHKLAYGNMDSSSGLTTFWLGGSLKISPEEQVRFLRNLYDKKLPVNANAIRDVQQMLVQPRGVIVNALGEHPFNNPWPDNVEVSAKTGSTTDASGMATRWLVGHIKKAEKSFIFVSCVTGSAELDANAAITLAAQSLRQQKIL